MRMRQRTLASVSALALVIGCSVGKLFDSPPVKVIGVTPARVVDSARAGSATTLPAALMISNDRIFSKTASMLLVHKDD